MADKIKITFAAFLVVLGVVGFYVLSDKPMVLRVLSVLGGLVAGAAVAWFSEPGQRFRVFAGESVEETKKVAWPTRKETLQTTGVVMAFVVVMALFMWLVDAGLLLVVKLITGQGGA